MTSSAHVPCLAACAALLAACASDPHSSRLAYESSGGPFTVSGGDLVARLGDIRVAVDDVMLHRNQLASLTIEFVNEGDSDAFAMIERTTPALAPLRGSVSRPPSEGGIAFVSWQPWSSRDGVALPPRGRLVLGLARDSVFARFPPAPADEIGFRIVSRSAGADRADELRFRITSLSALEEPNPSMR